MAYSCEPRGHLVALGMYIQGGSLSLSAWTSESRSCLRAHVTEAADEEFHVPPQQPVASMGAVLEDPEDGSTQWREMNLYD